MTKIIDLDGKGIRAHVRPAIGEDEKTIYAIRSKMEPLLTDRGTDSAEYSMQYQFAICMATTECIDGMPFPLVTGAEDGERIATIYRAWMKLPRNMFNAWRLAPSSVEETFNAADLLPPELLPEDVKNSPLLESAGSNNAKK